MNLAEAKALFLKELRSIERIIASACTRSRFGPSDHEDLSSALLLKLIENDYAVIRHFEGKSSFATFVTVVVQRFLIDQRNARWGRWLASAEATRLGPQAVAMERLIHRDGQTFEQAFQLMQSDDSLRITRAEFDELLGKLPRRLPRARTLALEELPVTQDPPAKETPSSRFFARERERLGLAASRVLDATIAGFSAEDRLLLKMRFESEMSVARIARATGEEQRRVYYRIERLALAMRKALEESGVDRRTAADLLESGSPTLSLAAFGNPSLPLSIDSGGRQLAAERSAK